MKPVFFFCIFGSLYHLFGGIGAQQKSFSRMKREIIADILQLADGIEEEKLKASAVEEFVKERIETDPQIQNFEGKKRAIIEAFIDKAENMDDEDVKREEIMDENPFDVLKSLIDDAHKIELLNRNEEGKSDQESKTNSVEAVPDSKNDIEVNLRESTLDENQNIGNVNQGIGIRKDESDLIQFILRKVFILRHLPVPNHLPPRFPVIPHFHQQQHMPHESHVLHCRRGYAGSQCVRGFCSVACPGGAKVQMFCTSNSVLVKNTGIDEMSKVEVSCG